MKPQTRAKITYWTMTAKIAPAVIGNVIKMLWMTYVKKDSAGAAACSDRCYRMFADRRFETERTYRVYKAGYELELK